MSIFKKLITAIRGTVTEAGEAIVDANQIVIFKQELHDSDKQLRDATDTLSTVMADEQMAKRDFEKLKKRVNELELSAQNAVTAGDDSLAMEIFERIHDITGELTGAEENYNSLSISAKSLEKQITDKKRLLKTLKSKISQLEAQDKLNKVNTKLQNTMGNSSSNIKGMTDSLSKVEDNIARQSAKNKAKQALANKESGADLDARISKLNGGSTPSGAERLAAMKAKMKTEKE